MERGLPIRVFIRIWEWQFGSGEEQTIIFLVIYGWPLINGDGFGLWSLFKKSWAVKNNNIVGLWFMGVHSSMLVVGFWSVFENALAVKRDNFDTKGIHRLVMGVEFWVFTILDYGFSHVKSAEILIWMPWPMWIWLVPHPSVLYFISSGLQAHRLHGCDHPTCARSLTFLVYQRGLLSIIAFQVQDM